MRELRSSHLSHHQPGPLPREEVGDQAWLINNAVAYSPVAAIQATSPAEALQAAQCKAQGRTLPRSTTVQVGNRFRETLPGDVLLAKQTAWMVECANQVRLIASPLSHPWKSLRQRSDQQAAVGTLAWSPDGTRLAAGDGSTGVALWQVKQDLACPLCSQKRLWSRSGKMEKRRKERIIMLILRRRSGEALVVNGTITIHILAIKGNRIKLGIVAPAATSIMRGEVLTPRVEPPSSSPDRESHGRASQS